jgi:sugar/nucleoside kinase (ribokinase family)
VRFVSVGDVMIDARISGRDHSASIKLTAGGSAVLSAVCAARAGAHATVVGRVGDDFPGRALALHLAQEGVDPLLTIDPSLPTGTFALVDGAVRVDRGANACDWEPVAPSADIALVSGYLSPATVASVLARIDASWIAVAAGRLTRVPQSAGVVFADAQEARTLTGKRDAADAARHLSAGVRIACVTLGADGAVAAAPGETARAAAPVRRPLAAAGAGDAFAAGFLLALAGGLSLEDALDAGCAAGTRAAR